MKLIFIVLLSVLSSSVFAGGGNVQFLYATDPGATVTPEYLWKGENCGGLSFVDLYEDSRFFTNNVIDCAVSDNFFVGTELSANNRGETAKLGIGRSFSVPGMKVFRVTAYPGVWSEFGDQPQVKFVWLTNDWQLTDTLAMYSTGFFRARKDAPDLYQPQVWLKKEGINFQLGCEVLGVGNHSDFQIAIKYVF